MAQKRVVDEDEIGSEVQKMLRSGERGWAYNRFMDWLRKQVAIAPDDNGIPELVGSTAAAEILGIPAPHVARLRRQGRMPVPVHVEGGHDVFIRTEVEALAGELRKEREQRAAAH